MFKTIFGFSLLLLVAATALAVPQVINPKADVHEGEVMAVTQDTIMLMDDRDNQMETFAVTPATKIIFNGNPAELMDVQMGDRATITGETTGGRLVALTITAFRPL